jgi:magnesium transporter
VNTGLPMAESNAAMGNIRPVIEVMGVVNDGSIVPGTTESIHPEDDASALATLRRHLAELPGQVEHRPGAFVWVALFHPNKHELAAVAEVFALPKLQVEDAGNPAQRPKVEIDSHHAFVVFKLLEYVEASNDIETGQMSVFVGPGYVVSVRDGSSGHLRWVLDRLARNAAASHGPLSVLHALLDHAVDEYIDVADAVSAEVAAIEESVFAPVRSDDTTKIYELKRENLEIRRAITPLVQVAHQLGGERGAQLPESLRPYFRDISDHVLRVADTVEANDTLLLTIMMASTARLDLQQNQDMRMISAWVAIAAVPTMIAGIYGMNFDDMPELNQVWGYPVVLSLMLTVCTLMYAKFRKSGWL